MFGIERDYSKLPNVLAVIITPVVQQTEEDCYAQTPNSTLRAYLATGVSVSPIWKDPDILAHLSDHIP